jgi:hypothetical protein
VNVVAAQLKNRSWTVMYRQPFHGNPLKLSISLSDARLCIMVLYAMRTVLDVGRIREIVRTWNRLRLQNGATG